MKNTPLIITTRQSPLALCQAEEVKAALQQFYPELSIQLLGLTTRADKMLNTPLIEIGGKGLFVKELEELLFNQGAHLAVHSLKDMTMDLPPGLALPVVCKREDVRDVLVSNRYSSLEELPMGARIGTSSLRRQCQLLALRSDLQVENLRGNVNSRLKRLDAGEFDALILAAAGLKRLSLVDRITAYLSVEQMLPAEGQGALALECRSEDQETQKLIAPLNDALTFASVTAERALCKTLGGNCRLPIAAYAEIKNQDLSLRALVGSCDGKTILRAQGQDGVANAQKLGEKLAKELLQQGADKILAALK